MTWNWQTIINFILFAMIIVAFVFAIWSYVKTNAIKNSNSPSVPTVINDNNTYVNNIASAPNVVLYQLNYDGSDTNYKLQSTDNGTTYYSAPLPAYPSQKLIFDINYSLPSGFYVNVVNSHNTDTLHFGYTISGTGLILIDLLPGQFICVGRSVSLVSSDDVSGNKTGLIATNGTLM